MEGVKAIQACLRADVEIVLMSGRRRALLAEDARLFGQRSYIFEVGAGVVLDGEVHWQTGDFEGGELTVTEQIERSGAPALLMERYGDRLELHDAWFGVREASYLFRGLVDPQQVTEMLADAGHGNLRFFDNGSLNKRSAALAHLSEIRAYHLIPAGMSKANAVAFHMRARGYARGETFAIGDSREDMACGQHVGRCWLVANALEHDPSLGDELADSVRVTAEGYGKGVYEAVVETLMGERSA